MSLSRIKAILLQEYFITRGSVEIILDIFFFPVMQIFVFGFLSVYLSKTVGPTVGQNILIGMLLWQMIYIIQYSVAVDSLWNIWSRNLSNLFISPLMVKEYFFAQLLSGIFKALLLLIVSSVFSIFVFHFNLFSLGIVNLFLFIVNLALFAFSVGIILLGLIFRFGTRIQGLAWGLLPLFQPLTAAFYPVSVLPEPLRTIAYFLSPTYVFEAARFTLANHSIEWNFIGLAFVENNI